MSTSVAAVSATAATLEGSIESLLITAAIGMARIAPAMFFLPYLRPKLIGGTVLRNTMMFVSAIGLAPAFMTTGKTVSQMALMPLLMKEVMIGLLIGYAMALPFWVAMAIGEFIDNQRGATISSTMDPAVGIKASPFASFFNLFWAAVFATGGGLLLVFEVLHESYMRFPVTEAIRFDPVLLGSAASLLTRAIVKGVILAAPMVIAMYLTELLLGLLSRFASQLNPFSMAMTLKSVVMLIVLLIYFGPVIPTTLFGLFDGLALIDHLQVVPEDG